MNGSKGYRADPSDNHVESLPVLSLTTVNKMLPLVERIVGDFLHGRHELNRLQPEEARLDRQRRDLSWPERQRRYEVKERVAGAEHEMQGAVEELGDLGVVLLDQDFGRVGFPTMVNNRRAFFSWRPGEDGLHTWHFAEDEVFRPIPAAWLKEISGAGGKN
ncbi:MAG: DUF2203 family protein [Gemmataceae bacterium]